MIVGGRMMCLSSVALFIEQCKTSMEYVMFSLPFPAVLQVQLPNVRLIQETILIHVVMSVVILIMSQNHRAKLVIEMVICICIGLQAALCIAIKIDGHSFFVVRLQILHVNLTRYRLIAIANRRSTFRDLYAAHPWTWNIIEGVGGRSATKVRQIFCQHLHIDAAQTQ